MGSFEDRLTALKSNVGSKSIRSPLNDPFYAESLIIQSKSIVGRMYSSNEYVRFKYECELNQLIKEYRVWLADIKREEREIGAKLDAMRQEQRDITKERRDFEAIQLVAKTNREFINHYKRCGLNKRHDHASFSSSDEKKPLHVLANDYAKENALKKVIRLPQIVSKVNRVARVTRERRTSLPAISSRNENIKSAETPKTKSETAYVKFSSPSKKLEHVKLVQELLKSEVDKTTQTNSSCMKHHRIEEQSSSANSSIEIKEDIQNKKPEFKQVNVLDQQESSSSLPASTVKKPRILSAPKSRSQSRQVLITAVTRPSSACETVS